MDFQSSLDFLRLASEALIRERLACLTCALAYHHADIEGVTASEAAEWLGLPAGRSAETSAGILLHKLGYRSYRGRKNRGRRLFIEGQAPEGWS